jgi:hypothetical protein
MCKHAHHHSVDNSPCSYCPHFINEQEDNKGADDTSDTQLSHDDDPVLISDSVIKSLDVDLQRSVE